MALTSQIFTYALTPANSPFVLVAQDGLSLSSIKVGTGGAGTILGTRSVAGLTSTPIPITDGDVVSFSTNNGIDEIIISITSGTIYIIGS